MSGTVRFTQVVEGVFQAVWDLAGCDRPAGKPPLAVGGHACSCAGNVYVLVGCRVRARRIAVVDVLELSARIAGAGAVALAMVLAR
jgi:hypothetical protein